MKALKKLDRKLNWWPRLKKKVAIVGLAAALLVPSSVFGVPLLIDANKKQEQEKALQELIAEPVPESFTADTRKKSLDLFVENRHGFCEKDGVWSYTDTGAYKKFEDIIKNVSERTSVPRYILAAMADYCEQCGSSPMGYYGWSGRTPITPKEAGLNGLVLWKDVEQDFLSAAGKYKRILREVQDEAIAIALMFTEKENVKKAKREAVTAHARVNEYHDWRSKRSAEDLEKYDAFVAKRNALPMKEWEKRSELEKEIKALFDDITKENLRDKVWHPDLFKVSLIPGYWRYQAWWVNNLSMGGGAVKIAKRLKRDEYQ